MKMTIDDLFVEIIDEIGGWFMATFPGLYETDWVGPDGRTMKLWYKSNKTKWIILSEWGEKEKLVVNAPVGRDTYELFGSNYDLADPAFFATVESDLAKIVDCHVNRTGWKHSGRTTIDDGS